LPRSDVKTWIARDIKATMNKPAKIAPVRVRRSAMAVIVGLGWLCALLVRRNAMQDITIQNLFFDVILFIFDVVKRSLKITR